MTPFRGFKPVTAREAGIGADKALSTTIDNSPADIANDNVGAVLTAVISENYNLSGWDATGGIPKHVLRLTFNNKTIEVDLSKTVSNLSAVTAQEIIDMLNADAGFSALAVATLSTDKPVITTLHKGTSATVLSPDAGANLLIDFPASAATGTAAPSLFQCTVIGADGEAADGAHVKVGVYDASTGGALLAGTYIQNARKGSFFSGENTNEAIIRPNSDGELDFDVTADLSGADELYIELIADVTDAWLSAALSRQNITKVA